MYERSRNHRRSLSSFSSFSLEWQDQLPGNVKAKFSRKRAVERIYGQFSQLVNDFILEHVNAVYLLNPESTDGLDVLPDGQKEPRAKTSRKPYKKRLIVYVDNSLVAAELDARKELIRFKYLSEFDVELVDFEVNISKGRYRASHPYIDEDSPLGAGIHQSGKCSEDEIVSRETLTPSELECIDSLMEKVEDPRLRKSFERAMAATFNRKRKNFNQDA